jgi:hypothetical protein
MDSLPDILSLGQVAATIGCSTRTLRRRIADGELRASRIADRGVWVVQKADLFAFLDRRASPMTYPALDKEKQPEHPRRFTRAPSDHGKLIVTPEMGRTA